MQPVTGGTDDSAWRSFSSKDVSTELVPLVLPLGVQPTALWTRRRKPLALHLRSAYDYKALLGFVLQDFPNQDIADTSFVNLDSLLDPGFSDLPEA